MQILIPNTDNPSKYKNPSSSDGCYIQINLVFSEKFRAHYLFHLHWQQVMGLFHLCAVIVRIGVIPPHWGIFANSILQHI